MDISAPAGRSCAIAGVADSRAAVVPSATGGLSLYRASDSPGRIMETCPSGVLVSAGESSYGRCEAYFEGGRSRPKRRSPPGCPPPPPRPPRLKRPRPPRPPRRPKSRPPGRPPPRLSKRGRSCEWGAPDGAECIGDAGAPREFPGSMAEDSVGAWDVDGPPNDSPGNGSSGAALVSAGQHAGPDAE